MATIEGGDTGIDNPIGVAVDSHGKIFITNGAKTFVTKENRLDQGPSTITSYAAGSNGDVKPIATITGVSKSYVPGRFIGFQFYLPSRPGSPEQLAKEWQGTFEGIGPVPGRKLWVWNQMPVNGGTPHVTMYVIGKDGDVTRKIDWECACLLSLSDFSEGLTIDSAGNLYMPSSECFGGNVETVTVAPDDGAGDKKPTITITGSAGSARGIAVDNAGNIYVTNSAVDVNSITVYPAGGSGKVTPIANIAGPSTLLDGPGAIALDSSRKIYIANGGGSVTVYPARSNGDVKPIATISGSHTGLVWPTGIAVDSDGYIYVTTEEGGPGRSGSVNIYSAGSDGNVAPIATISGTLTGLSQPHGIRWVLGSRVSSSPGSVGDVDSAGADSESLAKVRSKWCD